MADLKARSRDRWRKRGYHVENGETMMRAPGGIVRRHDIFGFTDLIALPEPATDTRQLLNPIGFAEDVLGVEVEDWQKEILHCLTTTTWVWIQSTSWSNATTRLRKIQNETVGSGQWERPIRELALMVLDRGDLILIEGWRKKKHRYEVREIWVTREDLNG